MLDLEITLLGEVTIQQDGAAITCRSAKALELLCYLVTYRDRSHDRTVLAEMLWPECDPVTSKRYLRQALWKLKAAVGLGGQDSQELIVAPHPARLQIGPTAIARLDIADLHRVEETAGHLRGTELTDQQAADLERVLARCRGEFLAGWDQEWCLYERARLEEARLSGLEQLIQWCESRELFVKGLHFGRQVLVASPARETTHRLLMRLHHLAGDRSSAARQFRQCGAALRQELGVAPSPATAHLYQLICTDDGTTAIPGQLAGENPVRDDALAGVRAQLDQIQAALDTLTCFVRERVAPRAALPDRPSISAASEPA